MRRRSGHQGKIAALFLIPLFVMFGVYLSYSFWFLIDTSFKKVDLSFTDELSVGWHNYAVVFTDPEFRRSVLDNLIFAAASIAVGLTVAFVIAVLLATGLRGRRAYLTIFLVPALTPVALVATIFGNMLEYQEGSLNSVLRSFGLGSLTQHWLTQTGWAFAAVIALFAYLIGLPILYYTSDLTAINTSVVEAALLDGAGPLRIMRSILHPMMRSTHVTVILSLLLGSFRAFEIVLLSTGGGPNGQTQIVSTYTYAFFTSGGSTIGFASASSVMVLIVALLVSGVQNIVLTREERRVRRAARRHRREIARRRDRDPAAVTPGGAQPPARTSDASPKTSTRAGIR